MRMASQSVCSSDIAADLGIYGLSYRGIFTDRSGSRHSDSDSHGRPPPYRRLECILKTQK